ncbi:MAG: universal stress protein [Proteobacteria bacterium]|nr:MAG: universal stress protein [Pseudomonadota bacterium]PIE68177.1 MAG: universal stress protein [Deltaproteobacteria bacterium]
MRPESKRVFRYAVSLAKQYDAKMLMLYVMEPLGELGRELIKKYLPDEMVDKVHDEGVTSIIKEIRQRVTRFYTEELEALGHKIDVQIDPLVVEGRHVASILEQAEAHNVDLIVMGNNHKRSSQTVNRVVKKSKIPVTVVQMGKDLGY